jgi:hypothetical protein
MSLRTAAVLHWRPGTAGFIEHYEALLKRHQLKYKVKGKAIPVQPWTSPEGFRR